MLSYKPIEATTILIMVLVVVGVENIGIPNTNLPYPPMNFFSEVTPKNFLDNQVAPSEMKAALLTNQMTLLKSLKDTCDLGSSNGVQLQEMQDLLYEMRNLMEMAFKELQNMLAMMKNGTYTNHGETPQQTESAGVCEDGWTEYQSSCYKVFESFANYKQATTKCKEHDAHLASIGSEGENSFVASLMKKDTFIGLDDEDKEGKFVWQDGSPLKYSNWKNGEPDDRDKDQDCVYLHPKDSDWHDYSCAYKFHYICEKRPQ